MGNRRVGAEHVLGGSDRRSAIGEEGGGTLGLTPMDSSDRAACQTDRRPARRQARLPGPLDVLEAGTDTGDEPGEVRGVPSRW